MRNGDKKVKLSKGMKEAVELLKKDDFHLENVEGTYVWKSYKLKNKSITTDMMNTLESKGLVHISYSTKSDSIARLVKQ